MNRIPVPTIEGESIDDYAILFKLARNYRLSVFPLLLNEEATIAGAYTKYLAANGNAQLISAVNPGCGNALKSLYESTYRKATPKDLQPLKKYRKQSLDLVCPMCGSSGTPTLDHVLPQSKFPEFAIFSLNLVPACNCNSLRQDKTTGAHGERVLHPYFDAILSKRLLRMDAVPPLENPELRLVILLDEGDPMLKAVKFHVKNVVMKTAILDRLIKRWAQLIREPVLVLPTLPSGPVAIGDLEMAIDDELNRLDVLHESKNNWESIFIAGLKEPGVLQFLLGRVNSPAPAVL
jgi:hypothetical protein